MGFQREALGESAGGQRLCSPDRQSFRFVAGAGSEATQQKPQGTPWPAAMGPISVVSVHTTKVWYGQVTVRPAEVIRPKQTKVWPCAGGALHRSSWGKHAPRPCQPHSEVSPHRTPARSKLPYLPRAPGEQLRRSVSVLPFTGVPGLLGDSCLSLADRVPTDFHTICDVGASSRLWRSGLQSSVWS